MLADRERLEMVNETQKVFLHGDHCRNVDGAIETLGHLADDLPYLPHSTVEIGPFGAFPLRSPELAHRAHDGLLDSPGGTPTSRVLSAQSQPSPSAISAGPNPMDQADQAVAGEVLTPWLEGIGEGTLLWPDATNNELWPLLSSPLLQPPPDRTLGQHGDGDYNVRPIAPQEWEHNEATLYSLFTVSYSNQPSPEDFSADDHIQELDPTISGSSSGRNTVERIPRSLSNMKNISKIPPESRFLLEHYFTQVVDYMCHFPNPQSPWRTIHFPCAMSTMADLLVFGDTNHARMALFYALLSVSANHLNSKISPAARLPGDGTIYFDSGGPDTGNYWLAKGSVFQRMAADQIHACLRSQSWALTDPEVYEELLMSLLSMVTISVTSGKLRSADTYLQHAERMININSRMLPRTTACRSGKIATLHHIYTYLHVIYSSTQVRQRRLQDYDGNTPLPGLSSPMALGPVTPPAFFPSGVGWPEDPDDPQFFARTYGVPRSLLALISQASVAAGEIESDTGSHEARSPTGFSCLARWQRLEDEICNWRVPRDDEESPGQNQNQSQSQSQPPYNPRIKSHLVQAMHDALIVMFFRRIRPINRIVLQHYVESAADHLNAQEEAKAQAGINAPALLWPWFMVATEAVGAPVRDKLSRWATVARRYGGRNLEVAERVVGEVWRRQDQKLPDQLWADVVREWDVTLVLT
ncbi:fungal-specific transcription factor domain-containing protein [Aspergillus carlsbadensis]|nr:fungal-specific transcription factor domain-containing protein [Aspergillus carlsbadensis]